MVSKNGQYCRIRYIFIFLESDLPVIAYAELIGITIRPTVRSAIAKLMINIFDT